MNSWWKKTVFYQIYMPSFCDGNGDGIGDFIGICSKLDYLKQLGVGCIWLTPFYPSPKVDQGYDVADYYNIDPDYGTMEDFQRFIQQAHARGIRVLADVVMNHTSTECEWFKQSRSSVNDPKRDWYIWKEPVNGKEPNNWQSFFGESAWELDERTGMYYYHSFAKEQVDLNWSNPQVKQAMFEMLDFWIEQGVDGFRLDVINNLSLTDEMRDNPTDEQGNQIHKYDVNQPGIRTLLQELQQHVKQKGDIFLVGEISSDQLELIRSYADDDLLDTTFNFNLGSMPSFEFDTFFLELKKMCKEYQGTHQPTIFFGSHDMPRFPSRFGFDQAQARNLFTLMMSFRAYPFLYFGDEIGMDNYTCYTIEQARDIQGVIAYKQAKQAGKTEQECLQALNKSSRDHSRNTMFWDDKAPNGGFSAVTPWIDWQPQNIASAQQQQQDSSSLFSYLRHLTALRSKMPVLSDGSCRVESPQQGVILCWRSLSETTLLAAINFSEQDVTLYLNMHGAKELCKTNEQAVCDFSDGSLTLCGKSSVVIVWESGINTENFSIDRNNLTE